MTVDINDFKKEAKIRELKAKAKQDRSTDPYISGNRPRYGTETRSDVGIGITPKHIKTE